MKIIMFDSGIQQPQDKGIMLKDILLEGTASLSLEHNVLKKQWVDRDKSYCIDANYWKGGNLKSYFEKGRRQLVFIGGLEEGRRLHDGKNCSRNFREGYRVYSDEGKSSSLTHSSKGGKGGYTGLYLTKDNIRKLHPIECERLQTVPDNYTSGVSNTQRYKMLGNGFTVDVIKHILSYI